MTQNQLSPVLGRLLSHVIAVDLVLLSYICTKMDVVTVASYTSIKVVILYSFDCV